MKEKLSAILLPVFLLLFCCSAIYAQKNFKNAYVVLKTGDTVRGKIDYRGWEVNPLKIRFEGAGIAHNYGPADLSYFEIDSADAYLTSIITKDMRPVDVVNQLPFSDRPNTTITDTVFLRIVSKGTAFNLYQLVDFKTHYYIQRANDTAVQELIFRRTLRDDNIIEEDPIYRNQLLGMAAGQNSPASVIKKIDKANYSERDLGAIVQLLNNVPATSVTEIKKRTGINFQLMAGGGINYYHFKFSSDIEKWGKLKFPAGTGPVAGVAIDLYGTRNLQRLAVRLGLSWSQCTYKGSYQSVQLTHQAEHSMLLKQNNISPEISLLYHFLQLTNVKIYAGLTFGMIYSSYPTNEYHNKLLDAPGEDNYYNELSFEKSWLLPSLMVGARVSDKVNIQVAAKGLNGFSAYGSIGAHPFMLQLTAHWIFISKK